MPEKSHAPREELSTINAAKYVVDTDINLEGLTEPLQLFSGSAQEGARKFPSNVNVAAALGLAGIGPYRTTLEIWADPSVERNTHFIHVDADSAAFDLNQQKRLGQPFCRTIILRARLGGQ